MGIKLKPIVIEDELDLTVLEGKIIAIDAPNIISSLLSFSVKQGNMKIDRTQRSFFHLYGLLYRVNFLYQKKTFPVFCFDGKESELKHPFTKDRYHDFLVAKEWYENAMFSKDYKTAKNIALSRDFFWPNIMKESKDILSSIGVPWVNSSFSAESQCAQFVKDGIVDFSNSQDFDSLLFGCPFTIRKLSKSHKRKVQGKWSYVNVIPTIIDLQHNLKILKINQFQLVDMSILIGTDYFKGIKGIGPKKALSLIRKHRNLETLISNEKKNYSFKDLSFDTIYKLRKIFLFPNVLSSDMGELHFSPPDSNRLSYLLCEDHSLSKVKVLKSINVLGKNYQTCKNYFSLSKPKKKNQSRITSFY